MNLGRIFGIGICVLQACAGVAYLFTADYRRGIYWLAAALLNTMVIL